MNVPDSRWNPDGSRRKPGVPEPAVALHPVAAPAFLPKAKRDFERCLEDGPLSPPSLRPRFRAPVAVTSTSATLMPGLGRGLPQQLCNRPMFPPSPPQSSSIQYHGTMMEAFTNAKHEQISKWLELAMQAARHSTLVAGLLTSVNSSTLIARLVEANAPSTLAQYLSKWAQWSSFSTCTGGSCYEPSVASLADFLVVHSRGKLGSAISWVKALRFVANRLELKILQESLRSEIVRAFCKNVNAVERRETAPLPLSFLVWLERQVLTTSHSAGHRLRCGMVLVCIWASLRWSDAQWSPPSHLHCDRHALIGTSVRTKVTSRSMPWAAFAPGFLTRPWTSPGWGQAWLCLVQQAVQRTSTVNPGFAPDFLVAHLGDDDHSPTFTAPLSRDAGILLLRRLLADCYSDVSPFSRPDLSLIGVHSAKVTLLSISKQLLLDEGLRREQGHHRAASGQSMSRLYGRDDIAGPLALQQKVVQAVAGGFRPLRPALRGAGPSLPDISVDVPPLDSSVSGAPTVIPRLADRAPLQLDRDTSSDSDEGADPPDVESRSAAPSAPWEIVNKDAPSTDLGEAEEYEFLYNSITQIVHLAKVCRPDHPACQFRSPASAGGEPLALRPGCSVRGALTLGSLQRVSSIPKGARLCLKRGCGKDPAVASLLSDC